MAVYKVYKNCPEAFFILFDNKNTVKGILIESISNLITKNNLGKVKKILELFPEITIEFSQSSETPHTIKLNIL